MSARTHPRTVRYGALTLRDPGIRPPRSCEVVLVATAFLVCVSSCACCFRREFAINTVLSAYEMEQTGAPAPTRTPQRVRRSALIRSAAITANASGAPTRPWATPRVYRQALDSSIGESPQRTERRDDIAHGRGCRA